MKTIQTDVVIIGGGTAGMNAYRAVRKHTDKLIMIEGNQFGTTCARIGCMPSKLLIVAADARYHAMHTEPFGIYINGQIEVDGKAVMHRVKSERDRFVGFVLETIDSYNPEHIMKGYARFLDEHTVEVDGGVRIQAKSFVIATGSRPHIKPEWQKLGKKLQVNDDVFYWDDLPKSIAVVGSGVIALELGQALTRLGVKTHIFGHSHNLGGISDPEVLQKARQVFGSELNLHIAADLKPSLEDDQVVVRWQENNREHTEKFELFLAAIGRIPNVDHLGLDKIGIELDKKSVPIVNKETLQSSIPHIFLAGDASNHLPLLHIAADEGATAGNNAGAYPTTPTAGLIRSHLSVVFTEPQIAVIGKSFRELDLENTVIGQVEFEGQGRSRVMLVNHGTLRVYFDKTSHVFLGAEDFGPAAEHIGHLLSWAHQQRLTVEQMLDMPFYHPVIEEGLRTALRDAAAQLK